MYLKDIERYLRSQPDIKYDDYVEDFIEHLKRRGNYHLKEDMLDLLLKELDSYIEEHDVCKNRRQ